MLNYSPADADNGYTAVGSTNLTYDGNHNVTYDGVNTLTYDAENRLVQAQNTLSGTSQYLYDPLGHRKQKLVSGVTTQFVLVGDDEIADYSGTGTGTPQLLTVRGIGGLPVAVVTPSTGVAVYFHHDALGSTVAVTQAGTSGPAEVYTYNEFGAPAGGSFSAYLFAGYRYDSETGLYYVHARFYSPQLGRFLQIDPIGFAGGRNLYVYVTNDPINRIDRWGTNGTPPQAGLVLSGGACFWICVGLSVNSQGNWFLDIGVGFPPGPFVSLMGTNNVQGYSEGWTLQGGYVVGVGGNSSSVGVGLTSPGVSLTYGIPLADAIPYLLGPYGAYLNWLSQQNITFDDPMSDFQ